MPNDEGIIDWLGNLPADKKCLLIAGGVISVSAGGYLIYRHLNNEWGDNDEKKSPDSPAELPADPEQPVSNQTDPSILIQQQTQRKTSEFIPTGGVSAKNSFDSNKGQTTLNETDVLLKVQRLRTEGNKFFHENNYEKALTYYDNAIKICPVEQKVDLAALHQNKAAVYEKLDEFSKVYEECTKALTLNSRYVKALMRRGNACQKLENWTEAAHDFVKCSILENFSREETTRKADQSFKAISQRLAKEYMEKRRSQNKPRPYSITVVRTTLKTFSCDPVMTRLKEALNEGLRAGVVPEVGQGDVAGVVVDGETDEENTKKNLAFEKIMQLMRQQRFDQIIDVCTREIDLPSSSSAKTSGHVIECLLVRSLFRNLIGQLDESRLDLEKIFQLLKDNDNNSDSNNQEEKNKFKCSASMMLGFCEYLSGNLDRAIENMNQALELCPENPDLYALRGQIKSVSPEDVEGAIVDFRRTVELKPEFLPYRILLLAVETKYSAERQNHVRLGQILHEVEQLIRQNPDNIDANLFYSQMMMEMDRREEATEHLRKALKLDPSNAEPIAQAALIDLMNGREDLFKRNVDKALEKDPYCIMALEILAQYYSRRSDVPKLMECYDKVLEASRSEMEVAHFIAMRETALMQMQMAEELMM